jgi:hypothetical protein
MTAVVGRPSRPSRSGGFHRAVRLVSGWAAFYTRGLDPRIATERRDELASDLWEQGADSEARGAAGAATGASILWRAVRGIPADLAWRHTEAGGSPTSELGGWTGRGSFFVATVIAAGVLAYSFITLGRLGITFAHGYLLPPATTVASVGLGAILLICGMLLIVRRRTRWLGAAWIAVLAPAVLFFATRALVDVSATFQWFYDGMIAFGAAPWLLFAGAFLAAIALFYLALAIAWFPPRRPRPTTQAEVAR